MVLVENLFVRRYRLQESIGFGYRLNGSLVTFLLVNVLKHELYSLSLPFSMICVSCGGYWLLTRSSFMLTILY